MRLVPAGTMPRDAALGVRMRRLLPGETEDGRGRRTFGPPDLGGCVAAWDSWSIQTDPDPIVIGSPFDYYIWPTTASVLCDGDCLEWALTMSGGPAAEPNVTIEAGADCVGVIVHVNDTGENLAGWNLLLTATLNGSPFGDTVQITPVPAVPDSWLYSTENGLHVDEDPLLFSYPCDAAWGGEAIILTVPDVSAINVSGFAWNASQSGTGFSWTEDLDAFGRPRITVSQIGDPATMCAAVETFTIAPTYDPGYGSPVAAGGPHVVSP